MAWPAAETIHIFGCSGDLVKVMTERLITYNSHEEVRCGEIDSNTNFALAKRILEWRDVFAFISPPAAEQRSGLPIFIALQPTSRLGKTITRLIGVWSHSLLLSL